MSAYLKNYFIDLDDIPHRTPKLTLIKGLNLIDDFNAISSIESVINDAWTCYYTRELFNEKDFHAKEDVTHLHRSVLRLFSCIKDDRFSEGFTMKRVRIPLEFDSLNEASLVEYTKILFDVFDHYFDSEVGQSSEHRVFSEVKWFLLAAMERSMLVLNAGK